MRFEPPTWKSDDASHADTYMTYPPKIGEVATHVIPVHLGWVFPGSLIKPTICNDKTDTTASADAAK